MSPAVLICSGTAVAGMSRAASSLSPVVSEWYDQQDEASEAACPVPDASCTGAALNSLVEIAELLAARTRRPPPPPDAAAQALRRMPFAVQIGVLHAAEALKMHCIVRLASAQVRLPSYARYRYYLDTVVAVLDSLIRARSPKGRRTHPWPRRGHFARRAFRARRPIGGGEACDSLGALA